MLLCALTLGFALPVTAEPDKGSFNTATGKDALKSNTTGSFNTAVGADALESNTTGNQSTAVGVQALQSNTIGGANTAVGVRALKSNIMGVFNTATGRDALFSNTSGNENTAVGEDSLTSNTTGGQNTAMGVHALNNTTTGFENTAMGFGALGNSNGLRNIAIGFNAGVNVTTGSDNIHIGNVGLVSGPGDTGVIRIGTGVQTRTFIGGIFGREVGPDGAFVVVDGNGKLGTTIAASSSRRVKDSIRDMDTTTAGLLKLRPVTFRYTPGHDDSGQTLQYGLIAEEVAEIYPELVVLDKEGQPSGVRYHVLPAMLLNELQRQQRQLDVQTSRLAEQDARLATQQRELDELRAQARLIDELTARLSRLEAKGAAAAR
jgi:hypothetical protein